MFVRRRGLREIKKREVSQWDCAMSGEEGRNIVEIIAPMMMVVPNSHVRKGGT